MKVKPLGDRVVVKRHDAEEKTAGGILLPDSAKNKPQQGKVVAVGDGRMLKDGSRRGLQVKVGDNVLFTAWAVILGNFHQSQWRVFVLISRLYEQDILICHVSLPSGAASFELP